MFTDGYEYKVKIEDFAKSHYIKVYVKKYKNAWPITEKAIIEMLVRFDELLISTDKVDKVLVNGQKMIVKIYFKIAGTKESAKSSGNRAIVYVDKELLICRVLLVYSKNNITSPNETQKWKEMIKVNYPEIWSYF